MNTPDRILSDVVVFNKYAKYLDDRKRRETYNEIVDRYLQMMVRKYPDLRDEILSSGEYIRERKILPSMRAFQFAGQAIEKNNFRQYNCCYLPIDDVLAFSEVTFLLLGGTGVGYSVQRHHVNRLPKIRKAFDEQKYLIGDSIEGWADAIKVLMQAYFGQRECMPRFDFSDIRPKGVRLVTAGGKAPGPEPLKECIKNIKNVLDTKVDGERLTPIEVHDIVCHIANSVLAGGIRRSALISLFSVDDQEMIEAKSGAWWEENPQRGRANNSAVFLRHRVTKGDFFSFWDKVKESGAGEPGVYFSNSEHWGTNPCAEIALRPFQACNLTEINASAIGSKQDFIEAARAAAFFGTLQAGFTDFHYLRKVWQETTEKEALIGVGITGIASGTIQDDWLREVASEVKRTNKEIAYQIGINAAARTTTVKPSGTTSLVLGCSSGIHAWHSEYYIRRMQLPKDDPLYLYLKETNPDLVPDYQHIPNTAVLEIAQKAPEIGIIRENETALDLLERVKTFNLRWVREGHRDGNNSNNVSATISIKDDEWEDVGEWMWDNKDTFNGLAVLPYDNGSYLQAPFEVIDEAEYLRRVELANEIDITKVLEEHDNTEVQAEIACGGGSCDLVFE